MMLKLLSKEKIIQKYEELEKENALLKKEKEALERELRKYKNSNTPPSANQHLKPNYSTKIVNVKPHKRGAPVGHLGITKPKQKTSNVNHILGTECPGCKSK